MKRREFVVAGTASTTALWSADAGADPAPGQRRGRDTYELRVLSFPSAEARNRYATYLQSAFIPAALRAGSSAVGAFTVADKPGELSIYVLLAFPAIAAYAAAEDRMLADEEFLRAGAGVNNLLPPDAPFSKAESSLLVAFRSWPRIKPPRQATANEPRVFELRTYESHSRKANKKKIEMFNVGESAAFERAGMQPVFFGETLVGPQVPNLTYMVTYPSQAERGALWQKFLADPEMKRLFAVPEYANNLVVSKIRSVNLAPLPGSQI